MKFLEKDLEQIIYDNQEKIEEKGLHINLYTWTISKMFRQFRLGSYGVADLINVEYIPVKNRKKDERSVPEHRALIITIIECKLNTIDFNAYSQAKRYVTAIKTFVEKLQLKNTAIFYRTILIGSEICLKGDFVFVNNNDPECRIYTYSYGIDGIKFHKDDKKWRLGGEIEQPDLLRYAKPLVKDFLKEEALPFPF